jgi:hypothetical protein
LAEAVEILAIVALRQGDYERAARLSGIAEAIWEALHVHRPATLYSKQMHARALDDMHANFSESILTSSWQQGHAMNLDTAVKYVSDIQLE